MFFKRVAIRAWNNTNKMIAVFLCLRLLQLLSKEFLIYIPFNLTRENLIIVKNFESFEDNFSNTSGLENIRIASFQFYLLLNLFNIKLFASIFPVELLMS